MQNKTAAAAANESLAGPIKVKEKLMKWGGREVNEEAKEFVKHTRLEF